MTHYLLAAPEQGESFAACALCNKTFRSRSFSFSLHNSTTPPAILLQLACSGSSSFAVSAIAPRTKYQLNTMNIGGMAKW
jgi:hypothetical protein